MKILVACEESQEVCKAFRARGHDAYSCDIQEPSGGHPEWHILGDALEIINGGRFTTMNGIKHVVSKWDMIIAHPPCTFLTNAGARHLWKNHELNLERYAKGLNAKRFFLQFYNADCEKIAVENPVPSRIYEMPNYDQIIQPYEYGHPFSKRTCLWLKNLPNLRATNVVKPIGTYCPSGSYSHNHDDRYRGIFTRDRAKNRSKTFPGIAKAMAEQWG